MNGNNDVTRERTERMAMEFARTIAPLPETPAGRSRAEGGRLPETPFARLESRYFAHRRRQRVMQWSAAAACVVAAGAAGTWFRARSLDSRGETLSYTVNGGPPPRTGSISGPELASAGDTVVAFSDGSRLRMRPRARGRVVDLGRRGGRIALDGGSAHVDVAHRPGADWRVDAGPFSVRVHGTAFWIAWTTDARRFDLRMENGVVSVSGPVPGRDVVVRAGERLSLALDDSGAWVAATEPSAPSPEQRPGNPGGSPPRRSDGGSAHRSGGADRWRSELADGQASTVVEDAERQGIERVLRRADSEQLAALADAARYVGRRPLARRVLIAQRQRFPGSPRAAEASFLLGRLDGESRGGARRALAWYDRYLAEAPTGAYASEALGRKMTVMQRIDRHGEAAAIAVDYLRRFPTGTYSRAAAALARRDEPPSEGPPAAEIPGSQRGAVGGSAHVP